MEWEGSLKGYHVVTKIIPKGGSLTTQKGTITVNDADEILIISTIGLDYKEGKNVLSLVKSKVEAIEPSYDKILKPHSKIHGEMFNHTTTSYSRRAIGIFNT